MKGNFVSQCEHVKSRVFVLLGCVVARNCKGVYFTHTVGIAQSVKASDCGPEDRGFDSHYPPHTTLMGIGVLPVSFKFWDIAKW